MVITRGKIRQERYGLFILVKMYVSHYMWERIVRITIGLNRRTIGLLATTRLEFMDLDRNSTHLSELRGTPNRLQHEAMNVCNKFEDILRCFREFI